MRWNFLARALLHRERCDMRIIRLGDEQLAGDPSAERSSQNNWLGGLG
jgi:hypothetical protein